MSCSRRRIVAAAATALVVIGCLVAEGGGRTVAPFAFFEPTVVVSPAEQQRLDRGETIVHVLPGSDGHIAVFAAARLNATPERMLERMQQIEQLKKSRFVPVVRRFSKPPVLEDLADLVLDEDDLDDLRRCRVGDCAVKLGAAEIERMTRAATAAGPAWRDRLQAEFREIVLARVGTFLSGGFPCLAPYEDRARPVQPSEVHAMVVRWSPFLRDVGTEPGDSFLYWSTEHAAGKPTVTVSHVTLVRTEQPGTPLALAISRQVYASHYMNGAVGVTAVIRSPDGMRHYLVYVNRTHIDVLGGFLAPLKRAIVEGRIEDETAGVFTELRRRIEQGS
jgi:hypothetical protein